MIVLLTPMPVHDDLFYARFYQCCVLYIFYWHQSHSQKNFTLVSAKKIGLLKQREKNIHLGSVQFHPVAIINVRPYIEL